jgi:hypothetical protein
MIRISEPTAVKGSKAFACTVELEGLIDDIRPIQGVDSLQAIEEACRFVNLYLANVGANKTLTWPTGEPYSGTIHASPT